MTGQKESIINKKMIENDDQIVKAKIVRILVVQESAICTNKKMKVRTNKKMVAAKPKKASITRPLQGSTSSSGAIALLVN